MKKKAWMSPIAPLTQITLAILNNVIIQGKNSYKEGERKFLFADTIIYIEKNPKPKLRSNQSILQGCRVQHKDAKILALL